MRTMHYLKATVLFVLVVCFVCVNGVSALAASGRPGAVQVTADGITYVTPEQFGAKGDGVTDDTEAFRKCMNSSEKNVLLQNTYLIRDYLTTNRTKYFYAPPQTMASERRLFVILRETISRFLSAME